MGEAWFRNPHSYIRECAEELVPRIAWDRGTLHKYQIDANRHIELYYPADFPYRLLAIGEQGAAELRPGRDMRHPAAVYPVWVAGEDSLAVLEDMLEHPAGLSESACRDSSLPPDQRPVLGQEHRVVLTCIPNGSSLAGRRLLAYLADLQAEYPDAILHYHNPTTLRQAFGVGLGAGDFDARFDAAKGAVWLGCGKRVRYEEAAKYPQWVHLASMTNGDLAVPRNRCIFNLRSVAWAAAHWGDNLPFAVSPTHSADPHAVTVAPPRVGRAYRGRSIPVEGDRFLCDTCTLQTSCKYFRHGEVCSVPEAEPAALARFFKTRDSDRIIEGLGTLLALQTRRLEDGVSAEQFEGVLNPEVTRILNSLFDHGVKLAKLVNPALAAAAAPKIGVQINQANMTPNALMAGVIAEFEARGISRDRITPEMVNALMAGESVLDAEATEVDVA